MTAPKPFTLACLGWFTFRVQVKIQIVYTQTGMIQMPKSVPIEPQEMIEWCKVNLQGNWTWGGRDRQEVRPFYIEDKNDAMLFKLTWFDKTTKPVFR